MFLYNFMDFVAVLSSTVITGGQAAPAAADTAAAAGEAAAGTAAAGGLGSLFGGGNMFTMILVYAAIFGGMWFFMIRPQRKREKALRDMQEALKVGDDVVTSSGFFGKIVSTGDDCFIVEFGSGKGVRIPVRKADIVGNKAPNINAPAVRD